ncbi:hypothetical protein [Streptomyces sp. NPDC002054]|uniref:hypothetical protein n=1 Tax=Streptomyces sp. NPDC002054 TaxID=3154663 RepID=UPI00331FC34E
MPLVEDHRAPAVDGGDLDRVRVLQPGGLHVDGEERLVGEEAAGPGGDLLALAGPRRRA